MQCAAVTTYLEATSVPPHQCLNPGTAMDTTQGYLLIGLTSEPPIILVFLTPHRQEGVFGFAVVVDVEVVVAVVVVEAVVVEVVAVVVDAVVDAVVVDTVVVDVVVVEGVVVEIVTN